MMTKRQQHHNAKNAQGSRAKPVTEPKPKATTRATTSKGKSGTNSRNNHRANCCLNQTKRTT